MATVNTIEKHFESMTPEQKKANLASVNYVRLLASTTNTNIARWDILSLFGSGDGANLLTDKKAINKIFFNKLGKLADKNTDKVTEVELPAELVKGIEGGFKENLERKKKEIKEQINGQLNYVRDYSNHLNRTWTNIVGLRTQLSMLDGNKNPIETVKKELNTVLKEGVWTNPIIVDNTLYLNTAANLVLTLKNRAAGQDVVFDVGQLAVKISLIDYQMWVIPYKNNKKYSYDGRSRDDALFHPHVNAYGEICWGNALDSAMKSLEVFQLSNTLRLLYAVLSQYNDGSPYVDLYEFSTHNIRYGRIPSDMKHPDRIRDASDEEDQRLADEERRAARERAFAQARSADGIPIIQP